MKEFQIKTFHFAQNKAKTSLGSCPEDSAAHLNLKRASLRRPIFYINCRLVYCCWFSIYTVHQSIQNQNLPTTFVLSFCDRNYLLHFPGNYFLLDFPGSVAPWLPRNIPHSCKVDLNPAARFLKVCQYNQLCRNSC